MLEGAVEKAGFGRDQLVQDKISGLGIAPGKLAVLAYFDNFGVLSNSPEDSVRCVQRMCDVLVSYGFRVHPVPGAISVNHRDPLISWGCASLGKEGFL